MGCAQSVPEVSAAEPIEVEVISGRDFHAEYDLTCKLGKGNYGVVYAASKVDGNSEEVAVKVLDLRSDKLRGSPLDQEGVADVDPNRSRAVRAEARMLQAAAGSNRVCRLLGLYVDGPFAYMVLEKCGATLHSALEQIPTLNEGTLRPFFRGMCAGVSFVHTKLIVHRDIKPDNFMCCGPAVKLCDFGLARLLPAPGKAISGVCGTACYMAPEVLSDQSYDMKADVWSLGVTAYVLFFGRLPYPRGTIAQMREVVCGERSEPSFLDDERGVSVPMVHWIRKLMWHNPSLRANSTSALMSFPFQTPPKIDLRPRLHSAQRCGALGGGGGRAPEVVAAVESRLLALQGRHRPQPKASHDASEVSTEAGSKPAGDSAHAPVAPASDDALSR